MQTEVVLDILKTKKRNVTLHDFRKGCHFKEYIRRLRVRGHIIKMVKQPCFVNPSIRIGYYSYHGKQDKPYVPNEDYQKEILNKLNDTLINPNTTTRNVEEFRQRTNLFAYYRLLKKTKVNKATLDFINKELTNYNLRGDNAK